MTQGWQIFAHQYEFVLGVDADTVLAPDAVAQLETEMLRVPSAAGVMARYTFDINMGTTFFARQLIRAQRMDFASWLTDIMARNRSTYVLGGQATLFRVKHLQEVTETFERNSPWDPDAQVEDMELTWRLHEAGRKTLVSATARAYAGPMITFKGLMGQRRKWDEGMAALLWQNKMPDRHTFIPWKQQFSMFSNAIVRILFAAMLILAISVHQFVWNPLWLIPVGIGIAVNIKVAWRVPDRKAADIVYSLLAFPAELWMWTRMYSTVMSWLNIWFGARRDGWAAQAAAESGKGGGSSAIGKLIGAFRPGGRGSGRRHLVVDREGRPRCAASGSHHRLERGHGAHHRADRLRPAEGAQADPRLPSLIFARRRSSAWSRDPLSHPLGCRSTVFQLSLLPLIFLLQGISRHVSLLCALDLSRCRPSDTDRWFDSRCSGHRSLGLRQSLRHCPSRHHRNGLDAGLGGQPVRQGVQCGYCRHDDSESRHRGVGRLVIQRPHRHRHSAEIVQ